MLPGNAISWDLPLSWTRSKENQLKHKKLYLSLSGTDWISSARIPEDKSFFDLEHVLNQYPKKRTLIRGCSFHIARYLQHKGFEILPIGSEAVLDLQSEIFKKKSLQSLVKRGIKFGKFEQIVPSEKNIQKLRLFKTQTRHGHKPQLHFLFNEQINSDIDSFVWKDNKGEWLAFVSISRINSLKAHTELLLKSKNSSTGIMEALLYNIFLVLKSKGYKYWSLGEVPFIFSKPNQPLSFRDRLIAKWGQKLSLVYNTQTLYSFKDKFSPQWQSVYIAGYPKISNLALLEMAIQTNYVKLLGYSILRKFNKDSI